MSVTSVTCQFYSQLSSHERDAGRNELIMTTAIWGACCLQVRVNRCREKNVESVICITDTPSAD